MTFTIPGTLPGLNELIAATNSNKHKGSKLKQSTEEAIAWQLKARRLAPIHGPVVVSFRWFDATGRDWDNVTSAKKYILDVLSPQCRAHPNGLGIIDGDGRKVVTWCYDDGGAADKANPRVEVTIREA